MTERSAPLNGEIPLNLLADSKLHAEPTVRLDNRTAKSRRCWHRVMCGIERGGELRFLTLTSSDTSPDDIQRSWRKLSMRLKRRNLVQGYIRVTEVAEDGRRHLHVLFRGSYISQRWISATWQAIHSAPVVDIRRFRVRHHRAEAANYMAKYMAKDSAGRYSWSWWWVWPGFVKHWTILKRRVRHAIPHDEAHWLATCIKTWHLCLQGKLKPDWEAWSYSYLR